MMNIAIISGTGFIGTNLVIALLKRNNLKLTVIDENEVFFSNLKKFNSKRIKCIVSKFDNETDYDSLVKAQQIVFYLTSTNIPGESNSNVAEELQQNINLAVKFLNACVRQKVQKIIFLSSGGAIYGTEGNSPHKETDIPFPISSYGIQKLTIENLLYLYYYQYNLDYRIIRLGNPYGPYQRPNGRLGVVTTFVYHALTDKKITIYGDGSVVRDFIYIDDAIKGIINIAFCQTRHKLYNLGLGKGYSINEVLKTIKSVVMPELNVDYISSRSADVPVNYLSMDRYCTEFGNLGALPLGVGIKKTAEFMKIFYGI